MLRKVEVINWRIFDHFIMEFSPGITFIMGANGTGKTSILEAIAYALSGEPSTVRDRTKLLRDPNLLATVRLWFRVEDRNYLIERSQSSTRADQAQLILENTQETLARSHKAVTEQIESIIGVSKDFLQRIIYMAEGDVFRFLSDPPGKAMDLQIRRVLGLTQLDEFAVAIDTAEKEIKDQIKASQFLFDQLIQLGVEDDAGLTKRLEVMDDRRKDLIANVRSLQTEIDRQRRENEDLLRLSPLMQRTEQSFGNYPSTLELLKEKAIISVFSDLETKNEEIQSKFREQITSVARLEGEELSYKRIMEILHPFVGSTETVPCPVCRKPMTIEDREKVTVEIHEELERLESEKQALMKIHNETNQISSGLKEQVEGLRELRNFISHVSLISVTQSATIKDLQNAVQSELIDVQQQISNLQDQASAIEDAISDIEKEKSEYLSLVARLQAMDYTSIEDANAALLELETRSLSLRAAKQGLQQTLGIQRNVDLASIYSQIAKIWNVFKGGQEYH